jgi:TPR repeat protein
MRRVIVFTLLLLFCSHPSLASPLEQGISAFERNDCGLARSTLLPLAVAGDSRAQVVIGQLYEHGCGEPRDYTEAYHWYLKASDQGNAEAAFYISALYFWGWGVKQDTSEAMKWTDRAARGGYTPAMIQMGLHYRDGCCGVIHDFAQAMTWFHEAADRGDAEGMFHIGYLYYFGLGVKQNCDEAVKWIMRAAEHGSGTAQAEMGELYEDATCGLKKDYAEALFWHSLPGALHSTVGAVKFDASHLTSKQRADVEKRIEKWRPLSAPGK